jgi:hypothetical protein
MMEDGFGDDKTYGKIMLALSALYILALLYGIGVFSMSFMPEQLAPVAQHQVVEYQQVCKNGVCNWMRME